MNGSRVAPKPEVETTGMNFSTTTSYSTPYTLCGTGSGGSRKSATPQKTLTPIFLNFGISEISKKLRVVRGPDPLAI